MTCITCRYSRWTIGINGLWFELHKRNCGPACDQWEREPGSDDDITEPRAGGA